MILTQLSHQLNSLNGLIGKLTNEQYQQKIQHLSNVSIGEHTRHIIELLQCAITGYRTGEVDYVNRQRNPELENNTHAAVAELQRLLSEMGREDKQLSITVEHRSVTGHLPVFTTYFREIIYNTEHAVHHLALIKVALLEMKLDLVNSNFGMAESTIKYKASLSIT